MRKAVIPFSGFYNSIHGSELDDRLEMMFSNDYDDCYKSLLEKAYDNIEWSYVHSEYAKEYVEVFAEEFELDIKFEALISPKYYNFETDRIFVYIELSEVERLFNLIPKEVLEKFIKANFTSYDGFISHYPNSLDQWPKNLSEWDHNHIGTLIQAYVYTIDNEFDQYKEYALMEDPICNGVIDGMLWDNMKDADRLCNINDYLRKREDRKTDY